MIVIREMKTDCCRHCHPHCAPHAAPGVWIEYCGVREFHCLRSLYLFLERLSVMPGVVGVLAAQASATATQQTLAHEPLKLGQKV